MDTTGVDWIQMDSIGLCLIGSIDYDWMHPCRAWTFHRQIGRTPAAHDRYPCRFDRGSKVLVMGIEVISKGVRMY